MRSAQGRGQIFSRTATGIEEAALLQLPPSSEIDAVSLALDVRCIRASDIWPFLPIDAEPAQVFERGRGIFCAAAIGVEVFHSHHEGADSGDGPLVSGEECPCVADVQIACRGGCEPAAIGR